MSEVNAWNTAPLSNQEAPPDGFPEGMNLRYVNDAAREVMASIARLYADTVRGITTGGTSTAYTITSSRVLSAYHTGLQFRVKFHVASGASPTLNVNGIGATALAWPNGVAIRSDEFPADAYADVVYSGSAWLVMNAGKRPVSAAGTGIAISNETISFSPYGVFEDLAAITFDQGDILVHDGTDLVRRAKHTNVDRGKWLKQTTAGAILWDFETVGNWAVWTTASVVEFSGNFIPWDDTVPLVTEGDELWSSGSLLLMADSVVKIAADLFIGCGGATNDIGEVAIFVGSTCIGFGHAPPPDADMAVPVPARAAYTVPSTGNYTFSVRWGRDTSASPTAYLNGSSTGARKGGGAMRSMVAMAEYLPAAEE